MSELTKGRIEIRRSAYSGGFYADVSCGGFTTSHLTKPTVEEAIEDGVERLKGELLENLKMREAEKRLANS